MRLFTRALLAAPLLAAGLVATQPAHAYWRGGGFHGGWHGGYHGYHGYGPGAVLGGLAAGALVGGVVAGALAPPVYYAPPPPVYYAPPPVYYAPPPY